MISSESVQAIERILHESLAESLEQARLVETARCTADDGSTSLGERVVVLTVAGFWFRLMPYIAAPSNLPTSTELNQDDYLYELGNVFCGAIKRRLGQAIPSLGISTPNMLTAAHLDYLSRARDKVLSLRVQAEIDGGGSLRAGLLVDAYQPLHLRLPEAAEVEVSHGALELF